jgi:hypothetical protein
MAVGAAAVGATGKASIQLSGRTVVAGNSAALWGALAVGGDGTLETQLEGANVTGNTLTEVGGSCHGKQARLRQSYAAILALVSQLGSAILPASCGLPSHEPLPPRASLN